MDVQSKRMRDLMQQPYYKLPNEEDIFVQFLYVLVYWRYTFSYLAAFTGKTGSLEKGVSFISTFFFNEGKHKKREAFP